MLGNINLTKIVLLPKMCYPVSMLFLFLKPVDLKYINKLIDFIWAGRKPKHKMDTLQLPKQEGGWALPKIENYILSIHARIVSVWVNEHVSPWLEIEKAISQPFCLITLLDKHAEELPPAVRDNYLINNVIKTWSILKKIFGKSQDLNFLAILADTPDLIKEGAGLNLKSWQEAGVRRIFDLWDKGKFKTFEDIRSQHSIPVKDLYKYLQIRHYVKSKTGSLELPTNCYLLEKTVLDCGKHGHFVSGFYSELQTLKADKLKHLRTTWNMLLKMSIDPESWEEIITLPSRISICNRYKET